MAEGDTPVTRLDPHADHDLLLVAEAADRPGQLPPTLAACPDCRTLHADLLALAAAVPTAALPARPRTYTLTQADADRLRAPAWRRWLGAVGTPRDAISRPLALGFTTIGLAGLLVATVPGALPSGGATGAAAERYESLQVAAPAASSAPADVSGGSGDGGAAVGGAGSGPDATAPASPATVPADLDGRAAISPATVVSGALILVGLGLFGVRRMAGRGNRPSDEPV